MDGPADQRRDDEQLWREFGHELENRRIKRGLDRQQLADQSGVSYHTISTLEAGGRNKGGTWVVPNPKDEHLAALARAVGVPVERWYKRVGRYADRPRTKSSRTGIGLGVAREEQEFRARMEQMERRQERMAELLGIDLDQLEKEGEGDLIPEVPPKRRRSANG